MVERGREARLAQEPLPEALVLAELRGEQLEGDRASEREMLRAIDDAHSPVTQEGLEAVPREFRAYTRDPGHA